MNHPISIHTADQTLIATAMSLASELGFTFSSQPLQDDAPWLELTQAGLQLHTPWFPNSRPLTIDFLQGESHHRLQYGGGKGQMIARAIGIKPHITPRVLDLTAGLGKDGMLLATLGCDITLVERSPILFALLRDGIHRATCHPNYHNLKITLQLANGKDALKSLTDKTFPNVIYYDPMFPHSNKSALVKKDMRILRQLVGNDDDSAELLALSRQCATQRVVVKRPQHAPFIDDQTPSFQYKGKRNRFDIYLTNH